TACHWTVRRCRLHWSARKSIGRAGRRNWVRESIAGQDGRRGRSRARPRTCVMVSVSAPTALAVRMADVAGITLAAIARADGFEVFTHPGRIHKEPLPTLP